MESKFCTTCGQRVEFHEEMCPDQLPYGFCRHCGVARTYNPDNVSDHDANCIFRVNIETRRKAEVEKHKRRFHQLQLERAKTIKKNPMSAYRFRAQDWLDTQGGRWNDVKSVAVMAVAEYMANQDGKSLWQPLKPEPEVAIIDPSTTTETP